MNYVKKEVLLLGLYVNLGVAASVTEQLCG